MQPMSLLCKLTPDLFREFQREVLWDELEIYCHAEGIYYVRFDTCLADLLFVDFNGVRLPSFCLSIGKNSPIVFQTVLEDM
jgi:hypothetical protein